MPSFSKPGMDASSAMAAADMEKAVANSAPLVMPAIRVAALAIWIMPRYRAYALWASVMDATPYASIFLAGEMYVKRPLAMKRPAAVLVIVS